MVFVHYGKTFLGRGRGMEVPRIKVGYIRRGWNNTTYVDIWLAKFASPTPLNAPLNTSVAG